MNEIQERIDGLPVVKSVVEKYDKRVFTRYIIVEEMETYGRPRKYCFSTPSVTSNKLVQFVFVLSAGTVTAASPVGRG
jgi:hypothetical protein